jgi:hypothetical protein
LPPQLVASVLDQASQPDASTASTRLRLIAVRDENAAATAAMAGPIAFAG